MQKDIIIRQLGNGDSFHPELTNTSFTLFNDKILVDCGYNVFQKLMELEILDKIKLVCITHCHDDHIGSLMTLIYWNEFKRKKPLYVVCNRETLDVIQSFVEKGIYAYPDSIEFQYTKVKLMYIPEDGSHLNSDLRKYLKKLNFKKESIHISYLTERSHGNFLNTGYTFIWKDYLIHITGDTKTFLGLEEYIKNIAKSYKVFNYIVFHDHSEINHPFSIHATDYEMNALYSEDFRKHIVKVHDNASFQKVWTEKDI